MWEEKQFMQSYDEHADSLFRYCYYRVYDRERAKELVQETFMRAWKQLTIGKDIRNPRAFLFTIARNLVIDESYKKKSVSLDMLSDQGFDVPEPHAVDQGLRFDARHALSKLESLDHEHREVVLLRFVEGLGPKEIASIVGESANVISVRLHRALKQLKKAVTRNEKTD
jgi:RNA polymerase sigma-70 factor, ECF subfamily